VSALVSRRVVLRGVGLGVLGAAVTAMDAGCSAPSARDGGTTTTSPRAPPSGPSAASKLLIVGPVGGTPVLLLHSWWGVKASVHAWATLLADAGHRVVVPDMFDGRTADTVAQAEALVASVGQDRGRAVAERAADELTAQGRPWAAIGFSLGALIACQLIGRGAGGPDEVHLFYGGSDPGGPISRTRRAFVHVVPDDPYFTTEEIATTQRALRAARVAVETFTYPNSRHWFAEPGTPGYDKTAFALARSRVTTHITAP
jgi:carboxymethylenebutenolidase